MVILAGLALAWATNSGTVLAGTDGCTSRTSGERIDRKSTRLNSSHLGISYAVFCLKKKNNIPSVDERRHDHYQTNPAQPHKHQNNRARHDVRLTMLYNKTLSIQMTHSL